MKRTFLFSMFVVLSVVPCLAQKRAFDETVLGNEARQAYRALLKIRLFAVGGIGEAGATSDGEKSFNVLLADKEARAAFRSLIKHGTIEGGIYGLLGLKVTGCDCFQQEFIAFKHVRTAENDKETFATQSGCLFWQATTKAEKESAIDEALQAFDQFKRSKN